MIFRRAYRPPIAADHADEDLSGSCSSTVENLRLSKNAHHTRRIASSLHSQLTSAHVWATMKPSSVISVLTALADAGVRIEGVSQAAERTVVALLPVLSVCELSLLLYACHVLDIKLPLSVVGEVVRHGCESAAESGTTDPSDLVRLLYFGEHLMLRERNNEQLSSTEEKGAQPDQQCIQAATTCISRNAQKLYFSATLQALELAAVPRQRLSEEMMTASCAASFFHCDGRMFESAILPVLIHHLTLFLRHDSREIPTATAALLLRMVGRNRHHIIRDDFFSYAARKQISETCFQLIHAVLPEVVLGTVVELAAAVDEVSDEFCPMLLKRSLLDVFDERCAELDAPRQRPSATGGDSVALISTNQVLMSFTYFPHCADRLFALLEEPGRIGEMNVHEVVHVLRLVNSRSRLSSDGSGQLVEATRRVHSLVDPLLAQIFVLVPEMACDECCYLLRELDMLKRWIEAPAPLIKKIKRQFYSTFWAKGLTDDGTLDERRGILLLFPDTDGRGRGGVEDVAASYLAVADEKLHPLEALKVFVTSIRRFEPFMLSDRQGLIAVQRLLCDWGLRSSCPDVHETLAVLGARYDPFVC